MAPIIMLVFMALPQLLERMAFLSDVTLTTSDGKRLQLHSGALASSSGFVLRAFEEQPGKKEFAVNETAEQLSLALSHMYDNCEPAPITLDNVRGLAAFFSKYNVPKGSAPCDSFLSASVELNAANLPEWIVLADHYKLAGFLEKCVTYAATHLDGLGMAAEEWMVQLMPATLTTLVSAFIKYASSAKSLYEALRRIQLMAVGSTTSPVLPYGGLWHSLT